MNPIRLFSFLIIGILHLLNPFFNDLAAQVPSDIVFLDDEGCLRYIMDEEDNRIVDFSYAGYKNRMEPLPEIPVSLSIDPIPGDNTIHIQSAIDEVAEMPMGDDGIRGTVLLSAGIYEINGTIQITASGVILRGVGNGLDSTSNTILKGVGDIPSERNLIEAGGLGQANWTDRVVGSTSTISSSFVPVGAKTLELSNPELYSIGDEVILFQPSTDAWLSSIDMGGTASDPGWSNGEIDIYFKREVTDVNLSTSKITLDVPIYDHFEKELTTAEIYILNDSNIKSNIGIENLRIEIETNGEFTEDHIRTAIFLKGVEDAWVRDITALNFSYAAVNMEVASRVTVLDCQGLEPHSLVEGGRRYNFAVNRYTNNILFENCTASFGRHAFVSNGTSSSSGIVWHNCTSINDLNTIEGHRRWSQALLFDQVTCIDPQVDRVMALYNRGSFGTGHGWSSVHSVAWNIDMPSTNQLVIQKPPHRQNYGIACQGEVNGEGPFTHPDGYIENVGDEPELNSLYLTQLNNRLEYGSPVDAPGRFQLNDLLFSWLDISDEEIAYVIEVSINSAPFEILVQLEPNTMQYTLDPSILESGLVQFRMFAKGVNCSSAYTHTISREEVNQTEDWLREQVTFRPNPADDWLYIDDVNHKIARIKICNLKGMTLLDSMRVERLNIAHFPTGIYIISLELQSGAQLNSKFVKR